MGSNMIRNLVQNHPLVLVFVAVIFLSIEQVRAGQTKYRDNPKGATTGHKNFCRNHIFSPRCRGIQKRDLIAHPIDEFRLTSLDDPSGFDQTRDSILNNPTLLAELLRKLIEVPEYENEAGNYLQ